MTREELEMGANKIGYKLTKIPCYQCSCYSDYPNKSHKHKNGAWKCIDKYYPIMLRQKGIYGTKTKCRKKALDCEG